MQKRNSHGIVNIKAKDPFDFAFKQGQIHAKDRLTQLMLTRLVAQGRLCECLADNKETLEIDIFMRKMEFNKQATKEAQDLKGDAFEFLMAYCNGINHHLKHHMRPLEFFLVGYRPEPWEIKDSLLIIKLMSYMGLAQSQQDIEKIIIELIKEGCNSQKLKSLFSPHLDKLSSSDINNIKETNIFSSLIPEEIRFSKLIPKIMASNNWAISGKLTKSGYPIQCNDPHLEINRLPAIWYESTGSVGKNKIAGVTMPGVPGILMGRNSSISYGFTYGFMDMVDYFTEEIKDHSLLREDKEIPVSTYKETILRKKNRPHEIYIHRSPLGIIESDHDKRKLSDGKYLCRAWAGELSGSTKSIESAFLFLEAKNCKDFLNACSNVTISCNWLVADIEGNIAYGQSGPLPKRNSSGLFPLSAFYYKNHWQGLHDKEKLGKIINPKQGYLCTANHQMTFENLPLSVNMPMGNYRYLRIKELIENNKDHDIFHMKNMQSDLYSYQAKLYMMVIKPYITVSVTGDILKSWDLKYDKNSKGAFLFEELYKLLLKSIFSKNFIEYKMWNHLTKETNILIDYFDRFDRIFLSDDEDIKSLWYNENSKEKIIKNCLDELSKRYDDNDRIPTWGSTRKVIMNNLFFGGKLPSFLGLDYGPIIIEGNRATISQGQVFNLHSRQSSFCASYRYICDLSTFKVYSILAGGVKDRPYSSLYKNEVEKWLNFEYKELNLDQ